MTAKAQNSILLYKGNPIESVKMGLSFQEKAVVDELLAYFSVDNTEELATLLSNM